MANNPIGKISPSDLEILIGALDVEFFWLSHCLVSPGYRLQMDGLPFAGIHYNIHGRGKMLIAGHTPIDLEPHTLVVVPKSTRFEIEVSGDEPSFDELKTVNGSDIVRRKSEIHEFVAGDANYAAISLVCGFFKASYGQTADLFTGLKEAIVERFGVRDHLEIRLKTAVDEYLSHEIGSDTMSGGLLKQVIILLLRRSLVSMDLWVERFAILRNPQIAKAFAAMVADPGGDHSVRSMAEIAAMSRSVFIKNFTEILGNSPMATLRALRMRQAARLLRNSYLSIDQVAKQCGYEKRSFFRAFDEAYGKGPGEYRAEMVHDTAESSIGH